MRQALLAQHGGQGALRAERSPDQVAVLAENEADTGGECSQRRTDGDDRYTGHALHYQLKFAAVNATRRGRWREREREREGRERGKGEREK